MRTGVRVLALLVLGLVVMELALRWALFRGPRYFAPLRRAELYADSLRGDLYFRLAHAWSEMSPRTPDRVHPELGWSQAAPHPENPLGLRHEPLLQAARKGPKFVVFGSSVIDGRPYDLRDTLPNQLARSLGKTVVDVSVGGFSPEQVLLMMKRYRDQFPQHPDDHWLISISTMDLDRSGTAVYGSLKPYFVADQQGLKLRGVPLPGEQLNVLRRAPEVAGGFLLAAYRRRWQLGQDRPDAGEVELNQALIEAIVDEVQHQGRTATFVLYTTRSEIHQPSWREPLIERALLRRGCRLVRMRQALQSASRPLRDYFADNGHLNGLGNQLACHHILKFLHRDVPTENLSLARLTAAPQPNAEVLGAWGELVAAWERGWLARAPGAPWRLSRSDPGDGWTAAGFDDRSWAWGSEVGKPEGTPGAPGDLWLRSSFDLQREAPRARLWVRHPATVSIYLDGHRVAQLGGSSGQRWRLLRYKQPLSSGQHQLAVYLEGSRAGEFEVQLLGSRR